MAAASIGTKLDCDAFAQTHSSTSHYDRASFVGLAVLPVSNHIPSRCHVHPFSCLFWQWRPPAESICCGTLLFSPHTPRATNVVRSLCFFCVQKYIVQGAHANPTCTSGQPYSKAVCAHHMRFIQRYHCKKVKSSPVLSQTRQPPRLYSHARSSNIVVKNDRRALQALFRQAFYK